MKKFIKKNWIALTALLVVIIILFVIMIGGKPPMKYKLSPQETVSIIADTSGQVSPLAVYGKVNKGDKSLLLIDVRNSDEFAKGHITNALNIPVLELFSERSLDLFEELADNSGKQLILYGQDQLQANGPRMLLQQVGYGNIGVMQGGYDFYRQLPLTDSVAKAQHICWKAELPLIDTSEFHNNTAALPKQAQAEKKPAKVIPVKREVKSGGGC
jgi:rhodanese-related sulfurtransferase